MDSSFHPFSDLFAQLGLPSDNESIRAFIDSHRPLPGNIKLADAAFWTPAQSALLKEQLKDDADWAEVIDQLNLALH
ncbi:DUF2789 domain-containing protein [Roseateles toxinivorans]|uniref:Uncharacterized protein DUF2789 n=1 Tax=Roseateles toxinivorans TaxID=270368 RepID=A0A4V3CTG7_9BURK|nr:DUF2789 domain-containing protein [Roseateles toxinivorans]TDP71767.1 uncharacterized protein DUF2789 [Roseateles toxinivorans]